MWQVLQAERGRRQAEVRAEKCGRELLEQRARCEVFFFYCEAGEVAAEGAGQDGGGRADTASS